MQILINGLISGATIALLALAFATVYLPTRVFHIALAGVYVVAPFLVWCLDRMAGLGWRVWPWRSLRESRSRSPANCSITARLNGKAGQGLHLVSSLGLYIVIVQFVALTWGNEVKVLRQGIDSILTFSAWS